MIPDNPYLKIQYEQLWAHARHQELQRLKFTNIYAIIVAGVLASFSLTVNYNPVVRVFLFFFLTLLSLFGLYITDAWNKSFAYYRELIRGINTLYELPDEPDYQKWRFPVWKTFLLFYSLTSGFFSALVYIELIGLEGPILNILHYVIFFLIWLIITVFFYYRNIKKSGEFLRYILKNIQEKLSLPPEWIKR